MHPSTCLLSSPDPSLALPAASNAKIGETREFSSDTTFYLDHLPGGQKASPRSVWPLWPGAPVLNPTLLSPPSLAVAPGDLTLARDCDRQLLQTLKCRHTFERMDKRCQGQRVKVLDDELLELLVRQRDRASKEAGVGKCESSEVETAKSRELQGFRGPPACVGSRIAWGSRFPGSAIELVLAQEWTERTSRQTPMPRKIHDRELLQPRSSFLHHVSRDEPKRFK